MIIKKKWHVVDRWAGAIVYVLKYILYNQMIALLANDQNCRY